jgi:hypothetical protein
MLLQPVGVLRAAETGQRVVAAGRLGGNVQQPAQRRVGVAQFAVRAQHGYSLAGVVGQPLEYREPLTLRALQALAAQQVGNDRRLARLALPEAEQQGGEQREEQQSGHADDQCPRSPAGQKLVTAGTDDEIERVMLELLIAVDALDAIGLGSKVQGAASCPAAHLLADGMLRRERPVDLARDVRPANHQALIVAAPEGYRPLLAEIDGAKDLLIAGEIEHGADQSEKDPLVVAQGARDDQAWPAGCPRIDHLGEEQPRLRVVPECDEVVAVAHLDARCPRPVGAVEQLSLGIEDPKTDDFAEVQQMQIEFIADWPRVPRGRLPAHDRSGQ